MVISRLRLTALGAALGLAMGAPGALASTVDDIIPVDQPASLSGSYLAGRSADAANDIDAALAYFSLTLQFDPGNPVLSERVLMLRLAAGDVKPAFDMAEKLIITDNRNPTARLALAVQSFKRGRYELAQTELKDILQSPLPTLTAGILKAWALQGLGKNEDALKTLDGLTGPAWFDIFKDYHRALIADAAGLDDEAEKAIETAYNDDNGALRVVEAYARIKARTGHRDEALKALNDYSDVQVSNPVIKGLMADLGAGRDIAPIVSNPKAGAAELLYGIGSAVGTEEGASLAAIYMQLAHYLSPESEIITLALGDIFQRADQCDKAIGIYKMVPEKSPLGRNAAINIGGCLDSLGREDEGAKYIKRIVDADPSDIEAAMALGNLYRAHDRFAEAADAFTVGVKAITDETKADWRIFYFRGVSYERTKRWAEAEADFKLALKLNPEQPQVLNYLGYSWVDMGVHLDEALDMIRTAVDLRPNDGYIVDSLAWAYYRLGRYEDAVPEAERAVELRADDPVINDHLGDVYWRVGRKREAMFQWAHARDLDPEEADLPVILAKLEHGLDAAPPAVTPQETPAPESPAATPAPEAPKVAAVNPADGVKAPSSVTVALGESLWSIAERIYGDANLYWRIYNANKDRITDPDIIYPGMTLVIPAPDQN